MAGIWDMITGQNPNQGAINASQNAANQATQAQNQLIQSALLPAYNALLQNYNQNYAPLQGGVSNAYAGMLGSNEAGPMSALAQAISADPALLQSLTGINALGTQQNDVNYLSNPGGTLSGLGGVGGMSLAGSLSPSMLSGITPAAMGMFGNEAQNGLSQQTIGSALNSQQAQTQQMINSLRNSVGAATPNIAGLTSDLQLQGLQGLTGTESQLAGMNQQFQNQGMLNALNAAGGLDTQQLQRLGFAQNVAGGIDAQTLQMLAQAAQMAGGVNQGAFGNLMTGANYAQGTLGDLSNYLGGGMNSLLGGTSGISNIANLYGQAAGGAANNAMNLANAGNQSNSNFFGGLTSAFGAAAPYIFG